MSFRDISKIIKAYEKKVKLQQRKKIQENNQQTTTKNTIDIHVLCQVYFKTTRPLKKHKEKF